MADENGMLVTPGTSPLKDVGNHKPSFFRGSVGASSRGSWQEKETKPQDPKKDGVTKVSTQGKNGTGADNNTGTKVESERAKNTYSGTIDNVLNQTISGLNEKEKEIFKKLEESNKESYILDNELKFKWEIDLKSSPAYLNWNAKLGGTTVFESSNLGRNYFTGLANQSPNDWNESQNKFISAKIMLDFYKAYEFVKDESAENKASLHNAFKKSSKAFNEGNRFAEENYIKKDSFTQIKEGDRVIGYDLEMLNGVTLHLRYGDIYNVSENSSTRFTSSKIYAISEDGKQVKFTDYIMRVHSGAIDTKIMDEYGALVGVARNMLVAGYLIQEGGKKK